MGTLKRIKRILKSNVLYRKEKIEESKVVPNQIREALSDIDDTIAKTKKSINETTKEFQNTVEDTLRDIRGNKKKAKAEHKAMKEALSKLSKDMKRDLYA